MDDSNNGYIEPDRLEWNPRDSVPIDRGGSLLGEGTFGSVFRGEFDGDTVAIKVIKAPRGVEGEHLSRARIAAERQHTREIKRLLNLRFRHVVQCYGISKSPMSNEVLIVTECLEGGSLFQSLEKARAANATVENVSFLRIASHIAKGLLHLHNTGFIHGDMKPHNVLLTESIVINNHTRTATFPSHVDAKIADFGMSKRLESNTQDLLTSTVDFGNAPCGTYAYMAPESFHGVQRLSDEELKSVDIFAFGVLLYEMLSGMIPWKFEGVQSPMQLQRLVCFDKLRPNWGPKRNSINPDYIKLVERCWHDDSKMRPSAKMILRSFATWLKNSSTNVSLDGRVLSPISSVNSSGSIQTLEHVKIHPLPSQRVTPAFQDDSAPPFVEVVSERIDPRIETRKVSEKPSSVLPNNAGPSDSRPDFVASQNQKQSKIVESNSSAESSSNIKRLSTGEFPEANYITNGDDAEDDENESSEGSTGESPAGCDLARFSTDRREGQNDTDPPQGTTAKYTKYWEERSAQSKLASSDTVSSSYNPGDSVVNLVQDDGKSANVAAADSNFGFSDTVGAYVFRVDSERIKEPENPGLDLPEGIPGLSPALFDAKHHHDPNQRIEFNESMLNAVKAQNQARQQATSFPTTSQLTGPDPSTHHAIPLSQPANGSIQSKDTEGPSARLSEDMASKCTVSHPSNVEFVNTNSSRIDTPKLPAASEANAAVGSGPVGLHMPGSGTSPVQSQRISYGQARIESMIEAFPDRKNSDVEGDPEIYGTTSSAASHLRAPSAAYPSSTKSSSPHTSPNSHLSLNPAVPVGLALPDTAAHPASSSNNHAAGGQIHGRENHGPASLTPHGRPYNIAPLQVPPGAEPSSMAGGYTSLPPSGSTFHGVQGGLPGTDGMYTTAQNFPNRTHGLTSAGIWQTLKQSDGRNAILKLWAEGHCGIIASALMIDDPQYSGVLRLKLIVELLLKVCSNRVTSKNPVWGKDLCIALGNASKARSVDAALAHATLYVPLIAMQAFQQDANVYSAACYALANLLKASNEIGDERRRNDIAGWISHAMVFNNVDPKARKATLANTASSAARNFVWMKEENAKAFFLRRQNSTATAADHLRDSMLHFQSDLLALESSLSAISAICYFPQYRFALVKMRIITAISMVVDRPLATGHWRLVAIVLSVLGSIGQCPVSPQDTQVVADALIGEGGIRTVLKVLDAAIRGRVMPVIEEGLRNLDGIARLNRVVSENVVQTGGVGTVVQAVFCVTEANLTAVNPRFAEVICNIVRLLCNHPAALTTMRQSGISNSLMLIVSRYSHAQRVSIPGNQALQLLQ